MMCVCVCVCTYTLLQCSTFPTCSTLSVVLTPVASIDPLLSIAIVVISLVCGLQACINDRSPTGLPGLALTRDVEDIVLNSFINDTLHEGKTLSHNIY